MEGDELAQRNVIRARCPPSGSAHTPLVCAARRRSSTRQPPHTLLGAFGAAAEVVMRRSPSAAPLAAALPSYRAGQVALMRQLAVDAAAADCMHLANASTATATSGAGVLIESTAIAAWVHELE